MGLSSNQARFLSLTSRQVDLEHRIQQICQRRLRLSSELENVATSYNNNISNRKMFTPSLAGIQSLKVSNLEALGYRVLGLGSNMMIKDRPPVVPVPGQISINTQQDFINLVTSLNNGTGDLSGKYILNCDIDLSNYNTQGKSLIDGIFKGTFDGNGHTIDNLKIDTGGAATGAIAMFSELNGAKVENIALTNFNINATNSTWVGGIAGGNGNGSVIDNCYATGKMQAVSNSGGIAGWSNSTITNCTADVDVTGSSNLGGIVGSNTGTVTNSVATGDVTGTSPYDIGGFVGGNYGGHIENSSATGNVIGSTCVGGFVGTNSGSGTIINSFATGNVTAPWTAGGFAGNNFGTGSITYSYAAGGTISGNTTNSFAFSGNVSNAGNTNFYQNNISVDNGGVDSGVETTGWDTSVWDLSGSLPQLKSTGYTSYTGDLEAGLRNGTYSLARPADEFSQDVITIDDAQYEKIDWRTTPEIYDELYKGDDVSAENKYDKTIEEINAQDKKLQLEQTTIEVEYKAVASEKEAVKKILDTNATSSFKYFS